LKSAKDKKVGEMKDRGKTTDPKGMTAT